MRLFTCVTVVVGIDILGRKDCYITKEMHVPSVSGHDEFPFRVYTLDTEYVLSIDGYLWWWQAQW